MLTGRRRRERESRAPPSTNNNKIVSTTGKLLRFFLVFTGGSEEDIFLFTGGSGDEGVLGEVAGLKGLCSIGESGTVFRDVIGRGVGCVEREGGVPASPSA